MKELKIKTFETRIFSWISDINMQKLNKEAECCWLPLSLYLVLPSLFISIHFNPTNTSRYLLIVKNYAKCWTYKKERRKGKRTGKKKNKALILRSYEVCNAVEDATMCTSAADIYTLPVKKNRMGEHRILLGLGSGRHEVSLSDAWVAFKGSWQKAAKAF